MQNHDTSAAETAVHTVTDQFGDAANQSTGIVMETFGQIFQQVAALAPKLVAAVLVIAVGYVIARLICRAVTALGQRLGLQRAAQRGGLVDSLQQAGIQRTVPQIIGTIVFWLLMFVFLTAACNIIGLPAVSRSMERVVAYIPKLLIATLVIVVGLMIAAFVRGMIATSADRIGISYAQQLASGSYYILALMTFIAAFEQLEIKFELLNYAILIAFACVALGFALAFGLGGRDVMGGILAGYYVRQRLQPGDLVALGPLKGRVREVGPVATVLETEEEGLSQRHSIPNVKMLNEAVR